jgi:LPXTG-motif cell wall-anchored protein
MFVLPVALWLAFGGTGRDGAPASARWRTALLFAATAGGVFILLNVPFLVLDYRGWAAAYHFQWSRPIDFTTNSIWYWGSRPRDVNDPALQRMLSTDSTLATAAGLVLAAGAGVLLRRRFGAYPWLQVCAAMLCLYLLLNKVHSPQYMLWLLPFFVLLRIRWGWIVAYSVVDACIGVGAMLMFSQGLDIGSGAAAQLVMIGVWGRAALLPVLAVAFLAAAPAWTAPAVGRKMHGTPPELSAPAQRKIEVLAG